MDHASRQPADGCNLLGARHRAVSLNARSDVFTYGNDMGNRLIGINPHRDFANQPMFDLAICRRGFVFNAFDLASFKYSREFDLKQVTSLARQDIENILSQSKAARNTELA